MMNKFIESLKLNKDLQCNLDNFTKKHKNKISYLCKKCRSNFNVLSFYGDLMRLAVCLEYAQTYTLDFYKEKDIPKEIFYETMKDIAIWCNNNDNKGLKNYGWIKNHLNAQLFKIGRLQYQLFICKNKTIDYSSMPFEYGDSLIYIHIPQGEKLQYSQCRESILQANEFFMTYFPEHQYKFYFSESWLLYDKNKAFMSDTSNIIQFQSMFNLINNSTDDRQAIERIFGKRKRNISKYPETTSLQRNAKKYMLEGNKLGIGIGVIDKDHICENSLNETNLNKNNEL